MKRTILATLALLTGLTLAGCSSDSVADEPAQASASAMSKQPTESAMSKEPTESAADAGMAKQGGWIDQAAYEADQARFHAAGDVVLFFNASWCPTCKQTVETWMPTACQPV